MDGGVCQLGYEEHGVRAEGGESPAGHRPCEKAASALLFPRYELHEGV